MFLGGSDSDTLKIICEHLGKETVKTLSYGNSKGRLGSVSTNKQEVGRELMSRIQVGQMSNTECLVFIRSLRPFKVRKYRLEKKKRALAQAKASRELEKMTLRTADETKSKAAFACDLADRDNSPRMDATEQFRGVKISQLKLVDSFDPGYEFD